MSAIPPDKAGAVIEKIVSDLVRRVGVEVESRGYRASNALRNAAMFVLRGDRHGRRYKIPGTYRHRVIKGTGERVKIRRRKVVSGAYYTASAPGEPPANRTGIFRLGWKQKVTVTHAGMQNRTVHAAIENGQRVGKYLLGEILESGTDDGRIAPRPYKDAVKERAEPEIKKIYRQKYLKGE